jgi:signal transduction histidine kinase
VSLAAVLLRDGRERLSVRAARGADGGEAAVLAFGDEVLAGEGVASREGLLGVALMVAGEPVGALVVGAREPSADEVKLLELAAERAAFAIHNARLYEQAVLDADVLERRLVASLQRQREEAARAAAERGRLLAHLVEAQEDERRRIALDIHDDYLQSLSAVRMQLERLGSASPNERVTAIADEVAATTERMRSLVFDLRPPALDWAGVASALRLYLDETSNQWGLAYELESRLEEEPPEEVRTIVYRIAQEAITNVRKHASASLVAVTLATREGGVLVTVRDDGRGVSESSSARSFGCAGMRERAEMAGGWWRISSEPGEGTLVEFWVPAGADAA